MRWICLIISVCRCYDRFRTASRSSPSLFLGPNVRVPLERLVGVTYLLGRGRAAACLRCW